MSIEHFETVKNLIQESENSGLLFEGHNLTGYSGKKLIGTLQRIAKYQESINAGCYLEIGVFQGLTLLSVAGMLDQTRPDQTKAYGIDNFSQFDPQNTNQSVIFERAEANNLNNYGLISSDYEDALEQLDSHLGSEKIGTYFVDGPHDYRSQLVCLQLAKPFLSDLSVIIVDDCNYQHVRLANRDFLMANPEFKLMFESYTKCHPANMDKQSERDARKGWWNGVNIIVHDPEDKLNKMLPTTVRDRVLFENEHIVHSAKYGFLAPDALSFVQSLFSMRLIRAFKQLRKMVSNARHMDKKFIGSHDNVNTFSENLPERNVNPKLSK